MKPPEHRRAQLSCRPGGRHLCTHWPLWAWGWDTVVKRPCLGASVEARQSVNSSFQKETHFEGSSSGQWIRVWKGGASGRSGQASGRS